MFVNEDHSIRRSGLCAKATYALRKPTKKGTESFFMSKLEDSECVPEYNKMISEKEGKRIAEKYGIKLGD